MMEEGTGWATEASAEQMRGIMGDWPLLCTNGLSSYPGRTREERSERLRESRADRLSDRYLDEFERSRRWLRLIPKRQTINRAGSSYGLKHQAEDYIGYVSNGMFIAAAIAEGFRVKRCDSGSPNAYFNISSLARRMRVGERRSCPRCGSMVYREPIDIQWEAAILRAEIEAAGYRIYGKLEAFSQPEVAG
jgi:hypothetical protein